MVYLEYCMETCQNTGNDVISRANQPYCTAAMLYNGDSVDKITHCLAKEGRLIDFSYAQCIRDARIDAFIADPVLFAQDASYGAGDLSHLKPGNVQWFLDFIIRMYPDSHEREPRLPACWNSFETLKFVRWSRILMFIIVIVIIIMVWRYYARIS